LKVKANLFPVRFKGAPKCVSAVQEREREREKSDGREREIERADRFCFSLRFVCILGCTHRQIYHYDVVINPVVKVANQKKPAALLRAVYNQLARDQANGKFQKELELCSYQFYPLFGGQTSELEAAGL